jgi:hypothetical protein
MEGNRQKGIQKTIYLDKQAFAVMSRLMIEEKRSLSDVINNSLRNYFSLEQSGKVRIFVDGKEAK